MVFALSRAAASGFLSRHPRLVQCRQQHGGKDGDDGNYHEELYKGEWHKSSVFHDPVLFYFLLFFTVKLCVLLYIIADFIFFDKRGDGTPE